MKKSSVIIIRNAAPHDFGGGERVPVFIAREVLRNTNLRPVVFSRSRKLLEFASVNNVPHRRTWWWSQQNWSGWRIALIPAYLMWQIVLFVYYTAYLFPQYRPRVVHVQSKDDFIAATLAARIHRAKVVWSDHADLKHIFRNLSVWYKNPVGKLVYLTSYLVDWIAVVSREDLRLISQHVPPGKVRDKMKVVYNGAFDSRRTVKKYQHFTIVSTGRLVIDKGIGELIDAFVKFNRSHGKSQLYLIGDGPERKRFEQQAGSHPAIRFLGYQKNPLKYVEKSHIFSLPTYHEGFSLGLVEACMLGLPVIATNVGGNPEIIHSGKSGLLIPTMDASALHDAICKLYNSSRLRSKLSAGAREAYETKFNFAHIIQYNFINYYESVA